MREVSVGGVVIGGTKQGWIRSTFRLIGILTLSWPIVSVVGAFSVDVRIEFI